MRVCNDPIQAGPGQRFVQRNCFLWLITFSGFAQNQSYDCRLEHPSIKQKTTILRRVRMTGSYPTGNDLTTHHGSPAGEVTSPYSQAREHAFGIRQPAPKTETPN